MTWVTEERAVSGQWSVISRFSPQASPYRSEELLFVTVHFDLPQNPGLPS
ncbi:MAG: hypothetical protein ACREP9_18040 [Candidatus Dormibacteraceae bacterium]